MFRSEPEDCAPMQRLVLAIIFVAVAAGVLVVAAGAVRAAWSTVDGVVHGDRRGGEVMEKVAFILLIALIVYVSVLGGA